MKRLPSLLAAALVTLTACATAAPPPAESTADTTVTTTASSATTITTARADDTTATAGSIDSTTAALATITTATTTAGTGTTTKSSVTTTTTRQPTTTVNAEKAWYQALVDSENAWLATCQLSNGAIAMTPIRSGKVKVNPYFADFAALSLLNQADKYAAKVRKYMDWHFAHLNTAQADPYGVDGTIFDYMISVTSGTVVLEEWLTAAPNYDSTDSYAATFLMVVAKYADKTGDTAYVVKNAAKIQRVVNVLFATMDNGLTRGRPNSDVKMLMDHCEVYAGLQAATALYRQVLVPAGAATAAEATRLQTAADNVAAHVESDLWAGSYYRNDIRADGSSYYPFSWAQYYPSAVAQTFPVLHGLLDPASQRAKDLYNQFCHRYDWENLNHPDDYVWGSNAYTAARMGDYTSVKTFLTAYQAMVTTSRGYPLYNADAAWACMTAYYMCEIV